MELYIHVFCTKYPWSLRLCWTHNLDQCESWLFAGSIVEWQDDDAIFEVRNYINGGEFIEFLLPGTLDNLRLTLTEFKDAETGEITSRVSAGQGKKIRINAAAFGKPAEEVRKLLPQYVIARKPAVLTPEDHIRLSHKKAEYRELINNSD